MGLRYAPFCFTEHGVLMLSSVLNSEAAIAVIIQVIRVFTRMRELLANHKNILLAPIWRATSTNLSRGS